MIQYYILWYHIISYEIIYVASHELIATAIYDLLDSM